MEKQNVQPQQEQDHLSPEIVSQLMILLKDPKIQVKYGCLNAILQYTKTQQSKKLFEGTDLFSQINKILNNQKFTKICLSILISFSSLQIFQKQFVRFVQPLIFNLKQWKDDLREQLALLCLLNISKYQSIIHEMINKDDKKGFLLEVIYGFMEIKEVRRWVITNIFVNVSSIQQGRKYICQQKIYLRFLNYINNEKQSVRLGVLKIIRNAAFEWQEQYFISEILKPQHDIVNKLGQHLAYLIQVAKLSSQASEEQIMKVLFEYQPNAEQSKRILKAMKVGSKQKALGEAGLVLDILLVLSNSGFAQRKVAIRQYPMREVMSLLRFSDLTQQYKDKIQALEVYCFI